jgi:hypothetical protein
VVATATSPSCSATPPSSCCCVSCDGLGGRCCGHRPSRALVASCGCSGGKPQDARAPLLTRVVPRGRAPCAGSISSKFLQGHLNYLHSHNEGLKGVDGRCLANLTWALAKLDLSADDSALTTELALTVAPFIIRTIDSSSPQVQAGLCGGERARARRTGAADAPHVARCCLAHTSGMLGPLAHAPRTSPTSGCARVHTRAGPRHDAVELREAAGCAPCCRDGPGVQDHRPAGGAGDARGRQDHV